MPGRSSELSTTDVGLVLGTLLNAAVEYEQSAVRHVDYQPVFADAMKARAKALFEVIERLELKILGDLTPYGRA
jgi:hypothetical protein